jgi:hypothetical protein
LFFTLVSEAMNNSSILIAAAIIAASGALIEQWGAKETTMRSGAGGSKTITVHVQSQ